ncbi:hypothetical protein TSTA_048440 [Talaromyces stipitatus ATCC 10500]|uniref:Transcription factor tstO n=1 Tax=Talaromyces stipitatus (strain ATCC 10500 / CBS 375.48 / QM 6759 / NRRL 1006) TaxID=441959 RepID=TSTO_TALSN|nr:uncharacterized protein TSTA_048440 [Talaromyces stipitatus ATCC 10500]XP_002485357.1 uncharacterized protein TSTA_048440 [Talaromyces stipitatus ATCC 10500]B8MKY7.1 RecName: Full=Transcription factor tstO; AltName: Full=Phomoidride biosynthesis cluster protein O [Talaromyces stipitatus ATCC 10500]EED15403.1 hypothetical protein TSTA_048440 [Talaromyces stipitatus ATCC 10500]EED15404.1 hypothetical protein TSTA_048440 [Talaromyces stipitatus ATCC 10500]
MDNQSTINNNGNNKVQQKVRSACDACQSAKVRCGREKPTCRRCQNQGKTCVYSHARPLGRPRKSGSASSTTTMTTTTVNMNDLRDDAMIIAGSVNGDSEYGSPTRFRSISRVNNDHGMNMNMNNDWPGIPPLPSAGPRIPDILLDDSDENYMDMFMSVRLLGSLSGPSTVTDHHPLPPPEEEDGQEGYQNQHQHHNDPHSLIADPSAATEWDLGFPFDQHSSSESLSLEPSSAGAHPGDIPTSSLSKDGMDFTHTRGSQKISPNPHSIDSRTSSRDKSFNHHRSLSTLGSRTPNTTTTSSSASSVGLTGSSTTGFSRRFRGGGGGVLSLSRRRTECTCCDSMLQILAELDRHIADRSAISLDLIIKLEKETRAQTVAILHCDLCSQTFRPRILILSGLVLEAVVELLEEILHQHQLLGYSTATTTSNTTSSSLSSSLSSSSWIPSGPAGMELASPPPSIFDNNNTSTTTTTSSISTANRPGKTVDICSLWLGDYEISGPEKQEFLKHLLTARLRDIAATIHQLHETMNRYRHRPAFKVGTLMLGEIYRHVQAIVKTLDQ